MGVCVYEPDEEMSTTDTSEDSVDVKVKPVRSSPTTGRKNKRKSLEPRRFNLESSEPKRRRLNSTGSEERSPTNLPPSRSPSPNIRGHLSPSKTILPQHIAPKKRFKLDALRELEEMERSRNKSETTDNEAQSVNPFRPWSESSESSPSALALVPEVPACIPLLLKGLNGEVPLGILPGLAGGQLLLPVQPPVQEEPLSLVKEKKQDEDEDDPEDKSCIGTSPVLASPRKPRLPPAIPAPASLLSEKETLSLEDKAKQRNYKNLTRERRIEANARERQRVHTITAAFDTLQAAIPTNEENVKLSKLSVIKIATAYIMALSRMAGYDYTEDRSAPSVESVLQHCRQTIFNETKVKRRN